MLEHDKCIKDAFGAIAATYGPRMSTGSRVVSCHPRSAQYWGVYGADSDGTAEWVTDTLTAVTAERVALQLAGQADRATVGFMAAGAGYVWERERFPRTLGGVEAMDLVTSFAPALDRLSLPYVPDFGGCYCYEVVEPFGAWLARELRYQGKLDHNKTYAEALYMIKALAST